MSLRTVFADRIHDSAVTTAKISSVAITTAKISSADIISGMYAYNNTALVGVLDPRDVKKKTNCPNCGAPVDRGGWSCAYCGTPY